MSAEESIIERINHQDEILPFIAKEIWDHPQIALQEEFASALLG